MTDGKRIAVVQGHPDPAGGHFGHALADAYAEGAAAAGHDVRIIKVATLDFPLLRTKQDWDHGEPPDAIRGAQSTIGWAEHLAIFYPLWLGSMPALLKAFWEQTFRPGFALSEPEVGGIGKQLLTGKSARIVVTMGMPALVYRWFFRAHSVKSFERNILRFCGIGPIAESLIGTVETTARAKREKWLARMRAFGREGK